MRQAAYSFSNMLRRDSELNRDLWAWFVRMPGIQAGNFVDDVTRNVRMTIGTNASLVGLQNGRQVNRKIASGYGLSSTSPSRSPSASACTIAAWVLPTSVTGGSYVIDTANSGNGFSIIVGYQSGYWNFFRGSYPTGTASASQITATAGAWQHILYTFSGSRAQGYLNGLQIIDVASSWAASTLSALTIGAADSGGSGPFGGDIDDVRIWTRWLSSAEAQQVYEDRGRGFEATLSPISCFARTVSSSSPTATPWLYARRSARIIGGGLS